MKLVFPQKKGTSAFLFTGNKEIALKSGYIEITDEQYEGLNSGTLQWSEGELIPYEKPQELIDAELAGEKRRQALVEIREIETWFSEYDNQVKQYERCVRLSLPYDNKLGSIEELDNQAVIKAQRLSELRNLVFKGE